MRFLCFGAGAVGTYVGGSLALADGQLVIVERPAVVGELQRRGLRLDLGVDAKRYRQGPLTLGPESVHFARSLDEALGLGPFDAAIYALKSYDTVAAAESMRPYAGRMPPVVCLSNGVDNEPTLAAALGSEKVIPATVTSAIGRVGPGDIRLERLRGMGIASGHPLSGRFVEAANAALLNCRAYADASAMKWSKMLTNLIANPTSAILDMTPAEIFANRRLYELEIGMLRECLEVMNAQRIPVVDLPGTPVRALALAVKLPLWISRPLVAKAAGAGRGGKMPSFYIDLHSGRGRSEVEFLHGAVVRAGQKAGVSTPINRFLTATVLDLTEGRVPLETYARQPEKLLAKVPARRET